MSLFSPLQQRSITFKNRIVVSPMCMYSSHDGFANDWHFVHLGTRAVGGAGAIVFESTAVEARGRISSHDLGIWKDEHIDGLARITAFVREQNCVPGIQIGHAGRKASTRRPWEGGGTETLADGGWENTVSASSIPFADDWLTPHALSLDEIGGIVQSFADAARRAVQAGFQIIEIHAAHGYLLHQFLSPLSNHRTDAYGGPLEHRTRIVREVFDAVRSVVPAELPVWIRISATDWVEGGWDLPQSIALAQSLKGIDLVDCSSGGNVPGAAIPVDIGYQVPFAEAIRAKGVVTGAVGLITGASQADAIIANGQADVVLLAREMLRNPYWPLQAAKELGVSLPWPRQYERARD